MWNYGWTYQGQKSPPSAPAHGHGEDSNWLDLVSRGWTRRFDGVHGGYVWDGGWQWWLAVVVVVIVVVFCNRCSCFFAVSGDE